MSSKNQDISTPLASSQSFTSILRFLNSNGSILKIATVGLIFSDIVIALVAFLSAFYFRQGEPIFYSPVNIWYPIDVTWAFRPYLGLLLFIPIVRLLALRHYGLYKLDGEYGYFEDLLNIFKSITISSLIVIVIVFLFRGIYAYRMFSYSRLVFVYDWVFALIGYSAVRLFLRAIQTMFRKHELNLIPTLIVGTGPEARVCIEEFIEEPKLGHKVVGAIVANNSQTQFADNNQILNVPILGSFSDIPSVAKQYNIKEVLITDQTLSAHDIFQVMMNCGRKHRLSFRVVPNLFNCLPGKTEIGQIGSLPMIKLFEEPLDGANKFLKRAIDVTIAVIGIVVTLPMWLIVAFLIKKESSGPILYRQERVGMDGRVFQMYKFRSMRADSDDLIHRELMKTTIADSQISNQGSDEQPIFGKIPNDPRLTRIGSWIRRYSVDELPNLLNVLVGDMSIVGPRPPIPYEVESYKEWHRARFHIKPGITGLWQVSGRNRLNFDQMVQLDLYYIENWSLWLELKILLKTIPVVLRGDNAY